MLGIPLSLPQKLANINVGAVLSSYLIFDEFHLLDPEKSLNTTITLLKLMKDISPFCLMTATLSNKFINRLSEFLDSKIIQVDEVDYKNFSYVKNNVRKYISSIDSSLSVESIIERHKEKSIVICNTVDRCVEIYKSLEIEKLKGNLSSELICIHSRFFQSDRKDKEEKISKYFNKESNKNVILVSTQVIEVGLDISCDVLHTELSPINSLLQRIGRCARWSGVGEIMVYDLPDKKNKYLPYEKELSISTMNEIKLLENKDIDFTISQKLIQKVMARFENQIFDEIQNGFNQSIENIKDCWLEGGKDKSRQLIRDIRSINFVLLPEGYKTESLYKYESLSINPYSIISKIKKKMDEYENEVPHFILKLEESNFDFDIEKELTPINIEDISTENIIALNSQCVGYSTNYGLDFDTYFDVQSKKNNLKQKTTYSINKDTYGQHVEWMIEYFESKKYSNIYPIHKIQQFKYSNFNFDDIIKYIFIFHDFGKLNIQWQKIVNDYQKLKEPEWNNSFLAHTDYDPNNEDDKFKINSIYRKYNVLRKPNHSGIGSFVINIVLPRIMQLEQNDENSSFINIIMTTIMRHHAAYSKKTSSFEISEDAKNMINELIKKFVPKMHTENLLELLPNKGDNGDLNRSIISFHNNYETFLYFILVRILRLSDQHSFEMNPNNKGELNE